jgi:6-phospho-beta-glucosidase
LSLKVAVVGGGSSYTPELMEGLLQLHHVFPVDEVVLLDVPEGEEKVRVVAQLAQRMVRAHGLSVRVEATLDRERALSGADFVVSQFRVGGLRARQRDEHLPLRHLMLGQETTGAGGFACALRTIPQALALAQDMERWAPRAWLVNFTNPSGIVTEALLRYGWPRTVGLCNVAIGVEKAVASSLGVDASRIEVHSMGLNHLTWMRVYLDGQDITRRILGLTPPEDGLARPANLPTARWARELLQTLGLLPNGYLHYYYEYEHALREELEAVARGEGTRADRVLDIERQLFGLYADPSLTEKPRLLEKRGGAYYSEAAVRLMVGLYRGSEGLQVLNVRNGSAMPELPSDAVVEAACRVSPEGAEPVAPGPMPPSVRALVGAVKVYEQLTVEAAVHGSRSLAYEALLAHPLVRSASAASALLDDILRENAPYLPAFFGGGR